VVGSANTLGIGLIKIKIGIEMAEANKYMVDLRFIRASPI
jgi:hypothetical protein